MKQILSCILLILGINIQAQDVTLTPNPSLVEGIYNMANLIQVVKSYGEMQNVSNNSLALKWEVTIVEAPEEWDVQICDANLCFSFNTLSNVSSSFSLPVNLEPDSLGIMEFGIKHNGTPGCGEYEVNLYSLDDLNTSLISNTYQFKINVEESCFTSTSNLEIEGLKIYPNPASENFTISVNDIVSTVHIFSVLGERMYAAPFQNGNAINIADYPNGLYMVRMMDENGDILKTSHLMKR